MLIDNIRSDSTDSRPKVCARVRWEDNSYPERELVFATEPAFGADLRPDPNAFMLAAFLPAMRLGETRLRIEGPICPQLKDGLDVAMQLLRKWHGSHGKVVAIETSEGSQAAPRAATARGACCMSGGVDSIHSFRPNRLHYSADHPDLVKDLLFIHGFDFGGTLKNSDNLGRYAAARDLLTQYARQQGAELLPVYMNARILEEDSSGDFFTPPICDRVFRRMHCRLCSRLFSPDDELVDPVFA